MAGAQEECLSVIIVFVLAAALASIHRVNWGDCFPLLAPES